MPPARDQRDCEKCDGKGTAIRCGCYPCQKGPESVYTCRKCGQSVRVNVEDKPDCPF